MYKRILAPIDGSDTAKRAFDIALETARENHAELIPLFIVDVPMVAYQAPGCDPSIVRDALLQEGENLKTEALAAMQRENVKGTPRVVEAEVPGSDVAQCILDEAHKTQADLVVMGTHGRRGVRRLMLGSVAERFARMSSCPVLLIPGSAASASPAHAATASAAAAAQSEKEPS
ncbi:universal stress protein [Trinickia violacea]|uniref:Universal stress protein n=1 Tax=Trinickia violacea TaxID=2571746 RepID=A0A4P8ILT8_9BURK|nr:universal stress protein [Trinickia violacea]QCP49888.1 universal stress protein [Trinickia violacea]